MPADRTERKPTAYERICADACEWCAKGMPLSLAPGVHWTGNRNPPRCTAPSRDAVIESLTQDVENYVAMKAGVEIRIGDMDAEVTRITKELDEAQAELKCANHREHILSLLSDANKTDLAALKQERDERQKRVSEWCVAAFGVGHAASLPQRGIRLAEEAIEAAQAAGCDLAMVHKLVDHVYARPAGNLSQELGGIGVTVLALAQAAGVSAEAEEIREIERVLAKPLAHFAARNKAKNEAGFNVVDAARTAQQEGKP